MLLIGVFGLAVMTLIPVFSSGERLPQTIETHPIVEKVVADPFKKLDSQYCIKYGNENAPIKVVEFFSFQCPHCIKLFRDDFELIKANLIETGKIYFEFHPVPQDLSTAQALICFEQLEEHEKRLFLEVIFEEATPSDSELMSKLMVAAMNVFKKPIPQLDDHNFLQEHKVFEEIYHFLKQDKIAAVPTVEINGHLFANEVPDYQFINSFIKD